MLHEAGSLARKKAEQAKVELKNLRLERPAYDDLIRIKGKLIVKNNRNTSLSQVVRELVRVYESGVS